VIRSSAEQLTYLSTRQRGLVGLLLAADFAYAFLNIAAMPQINDKAAKSAEGKTLSLESTSCSTLNEHIDAKKGITFAAQAGRITAKCVNKPSTP
jgi:hypothetical protein